MASSDPPFNLRDLPRSQETLGSSSRTVSSSSGGSLGSTDTGLTSVLSEPHNVAVQGDSPLANDHPINSAGSPRAIPPTDDHARERDVHPERRLGGRRSSSHGSRIKDVVKSGWQQVLDRKLSFTQALVVCCFNLVILTINIITLLTSDKPTDKVVQTSKEIADMQKVLVDQGAHIVKTSNQTLKVNEETLRAEIELLKTEKEDLKHEKDVLDKLFELKKWETYREYIKGCEAYAVRLGP